MVGSTPGDPPVVFLTLSAGQEAWIETGPGGRPEIHIALSAADTQDSAQRAQRAQRVCGQLEVGRVHLALGGRGRIWIDPEVDRPEVPVAILVRAQPGTPPLREDLDPGEAWHVLTVLGRGEVSDLDSRYWVGRRDAPQDRVQFRESEMAARGQTADWLDDHLVGVGRSGDGQEVRLVPRAARSMARLAEVWEEEQGQPLRFSRTRSGFRRFEDQQESWSRNIEEDARSFYRRTRLLVHPRKVAVPGYSQHGTGAAVDVHLEAATNPRFLKLAYLHGWIRSEIRTRWRDGDFHHVWVDRPHLLYVGTDGEPVGYLSRL